ncbi:acyltransferase [Shewanella sp. HL-SH8]|uniref:acyltransferase n=1 Tax=Shewanella sp. HL-SH8 TaxID=3436242 RepID=UPI003EB733DE
MLNRIVLFHVRVFLINIYIKYLKLKGVDIADGARVSLKARIDFTNPKGIHISSGAYIAFDAIVLSHCFVRAQHVDTYIGKNSFIGAGSIIMPGVIVGESSIVGAGSVVTKNVPDNVIVAGNPAKIIKTGIKTDVFGLLLND